MRWSYSDGWRALSGRLKFTVRRHKFNKDYLPGQEVASEYAVGDIDSPEAVVAFCQAHKVPTPPQNPRPCLTNSVYENVLQNSIPAQIRQLILYIGDDYG